MSRFTALFVVPLTLILADIAIGQDPPTSTLCVAGLSQPVEILRDRWGIAHIYAQNEDDLFFAQGYNAARDRLFQFELWRLHMFRENLSEELSFYHPRGERIVGAFVRGVNACADAKRRSVDSRA